MRVFRYLLRERRKLSKVAYKTFSFISLIGPILNNSSFAFTRGLRQGSISRRVGASRSRTLFRVRRREGTLHHADQLAYARRLRALPPGRVVQRRFDVDLDALRQPLRPEDSRMAADLRPARGWSFDSAVARPPRRHGQGDGVARGPGTGQAAADHAGAARTRRPLAPPDSDGRGRAPVRRYRAGGGGVRKTDSGQLLDRGGGTLQDLPAPRRGCGGARAGRGGTEIGPARMPPGHN